MCYAEGAQAAVWGQKACDFDRGLVDPQQRRLTGPERGDSRVRSEVLHVYTAQPCSLLRHRQALDLKPELPHYDRGGHLPLSRRKSKQPQGMPMARDPGPTASSPDAPAWWAVLPQQGYGPASFK